MIADQIMTAAAGARTHVDLNDIAKKLWRLHGEGFLDDAAATACSEALEGRRTAMRAGTAFRPTKAASGPRRPPRSPDRAASIERRRRVAASGSLPPAIAARFTLGEQAALSVIAGEVRRRGRCELPIDALAAMAGVSRTSVQNAMRQAVRLGFLTVTERRRRGRPSDTNVVAIVDAAWRAWLRLGAGGGDGFKMVSATDTGVSRGSNKAHRFAGEKRISEPHRPRFKGRLVSEKQGEPQRA